MKMLRFILALVVSLAMVSGTVSPAQAISRPITPERTGGHFINTPPLADGQFVSTNQGEPIGITLTASDIDGDVLTFNITGGPYHGVLSGTAPNLIYTPNLDDLVPDRFEFNVYDGTDYSNLGLIRIGQWIEGPDSHQYMFVSDSGIWYTSEEAAVFAGGHLVTINTIEEQSWLHDSFGAYGDAWTGLTDQALEGNFVWVTGEAFTYNNWNPSEPNNSGNEDFGVINRDGGWNDLNGESTLNAIFERETDTIIPVIDSFSPTFAATNDTMTITGSDLIDATSVILGGREVSSFTTNASGISAVVGTGRSGFVVVTTPQGTAIKTGFTYLNNVPAAGDQSIVTNENVKVAITLTGMDPDGTELGYTIVDSPTHGGLAGDPPYLEYTPNNYYSGTDSFTFFVNDGSDNSNLGTIYITINNLNLPGEWVTNPDNGHQYFLDESGGNWLEARAKAEAQGAHLVTIGSEEEQNWLSNTYGLFEYWTWIGLSDYIQEGTFLWVTGEPLTYTNWAAGQPDNQGDFEDYAHLWITDGRHTWNDNALDGSCPWAIYEIGMDATPPVLTSFSPATAGWGDNVTITGTGLSDTV
jgi:hypothetical protein